MILDIILPLVVLIGIIYILIKATIETYEENKKESKTLEKLKQAKLSKKELDKLQNEYKKQKAEREKLIRRRNYTIPTEVINRNDYKCSVCGRSEKNDKIKLEIKYKTPLSKGGSKDINNLQTICLDCKKKRLLQLKCIDSRNIEEIEKDYFFTNSKNKNKNKDIGDIKNFYNIKKRIILINKLNSNNANCIYVIGYNVNQLSDSIKNDSKPNVTKIRNLEVSLKNFAKTADEIFPLIYKYNKENINEYKTTLNKYDYDDLNENDLKTIETSIFNINPRKNDIKELTNFKKEISAMPNFRPTFNKSKNMAVRACDNIINYLNQMIKEAIEIKYETIKIRNLTNKSNNRNKIKQKSHNDDEQRALRNRQKEKINLKNEKNQLNNDKLKALKKQNEKKGIKEKDESTQDILDMM